jgi:serralysin
MTTLTITTTNDFSNTTLVNITDIVFDNAVPSPPAAIATFSASQFNLVGISDSVNITGDADQNVIIVNLNTAHSFDASGWNITNWNFPDFVAIVGTNGVDSITGPSANAGYVYLRGGAGADIVYGGNATNIFTFEAGDITSGDQIVGGAGFDILSPNQDGSTYDFRLVEMSSIDSLDLNNGGGASKVILGGDQIGAGAIGWIRGPGNGNVVVQGQSVDLSTVQFTGWDDGVDALRLAGTKGADSLVGSSVTETLLGGKGHDLFAGNGGNDTFDFNSIFDSLRGAAKRDVISDFSVGDNAAGGFDDDLIDLKTIDANSLKAGNQAFHLIAGTKFHHKAGELMVKYNSVNDITLIQADVDGNGRADFQLELTGQKGLSALDFIL